MSEAHILNLIVRPETAYDDREYLELIGHMDTGFRAEDFVVINDRSRCYFVKINQRPVSISPALGRDDANVFSSIVKKLMGFIKSMGIEEHSLLHFRVRLIAEKDDSTGKITEVLSAPRYGSLARMATVSESIEFLELPAYMDSACIGKIYPSGIPVCIDAGIVRHHLLIAGATGQGKSTCMSNVIASVQAMGGTVFIFDLKPDYQSIEKTSAWANVYIPRECVSYWNLNTKGFRSDTKDIRVRFSEIDGDLYIEHVTASAQGDNQQIAFLKMLRRFQDWNAGKHYTVQDFYKTIPRGLSPKDSGYEEDKRRLSAYFPGGDIPHSYTLQRHERITRAPRWVDGIDDVGSGAFSRGVGTSFFEERQFLKPGHIHVIQVQPNADDYGLFVATLYSKILEQKELHKLSHPVLMIVDEAEDIFRGGDRSSMCIGQIAKNLRAGRSRNVGMMLSVQSASSVPEHLANNFLSTIAFRHNSSAAAGHLKEIMGDEASRLQNLSRGHAMIKMHGAKSVVRVEMEPEAFELTKMLE